MDKLINENAVKINCVAACAGCELCSSINLTGSNIRDEEAPTSKGSLYAAEALIYYFYFLPATNRA